MTYPTKPYYRCHKCNRLTPYREAICTDGSWCDTPTYPDEHIPLTPKPKPSNT